MKQNGKRIGILVVGIFPFSFFCQGYQHIFAALHIAACLIPHSAEETFPRILTFLASSLSAVSSLLRLQRERERDRSVS